MSKFVNPHFSTSHPGAERVENAMLYVKSLNLGSGGSGALAVLKQTVHNWFEARRLAAQDAKMWEQAQHDPRVMADIRVASALAS